MSHVLEDFISQTYQYKNAFFEAELKKKKKKSVKGPLHAYCKEKDFVAFPFPLIQQQNYNLPWKGRTAVKVLLFIVYLLGHVAYLLCFIPLPGFFTVKCKLFPKITFQRHLCHTAANDILKVVTFLTQVIIGIAIARTIGVMVCESNSDIGISLAYLKEVNHVHNNLFE